MDEKDWTKDVLMPLLRRLGFIKVEYTHGPSETRGATLSLRNSTDSGFCGTTARR